MEEEDDFTIECTQEEVEELTERLLDNDDNNCAKFFRYNLQERRQGTEDVCDEPLFSDVQPELFEVPTIATLLALHDNYEPVVSEEEEVTREEIQEERDFIDACVDTKVMEMAQEWLVSKGLIADDKVTFKRFLHRMWFALYPRAHRVKGSCAFEHVFLGEVKRGVVKGFHNWLFFLMQEQKGEVDYYGFNYALSLRGKGCVIKSVFEWDGMVKPVSSIFLGLSPELELAIYTICALIRPDDAVQISLAGKTIDVRTHVFKQRGKKYLGSAYPDL